MLNVDASSAQSRNTHLQNVDIKDFWQKLMTFRAFVLGIIYFFCLKKAMILCPLVVYSVRHKRAVTAHRPMLAASMKWSCSPSPTLSNVRLQWRWRSLVISVWVKLMHWSACLPQHVLQTYNPLLHLGITAVNVKEGRDRWVCFSVGGARVSGRVCVWSAVTVAQQTVWPTDLQTAEGRCRLWPSCFCKDMKSSLDSVSELGASVKQTHVNYTVKRLFNPKTKMNSITQITPITSSDF